MMFALLTVITALQAQEPKPQVLAYAPPPHAERPVSAPTPPAPPVAEAPVVETEAEPEPQTRQVCRYREVTGQRFPVRSCRTVVVSPSDGQ